MSMRSFRISGNTGVLLALSVIVTIGAVEYGRRAVIAKQNQPPVETRPVDPDYLKAGGTSPAFKLPDAQGVEHQFDELRGGEKTVLLSLCGCSKCRSFVEFAEELHRETGIERPRQIAIVNFPSEAEESFRAHTGYKGTILYDPTEKVVKAYNGLPCPRYYAIDLDGKFIAVSEQGMPEMPMIGQMYAGLIGANDEELLRKVMEKVAEEDPNMEAALERLPPKSGDDELPSDIYAEY